jgi:TonB family protein
MAATLDESSGSGSVGKSARPFRRGDFDRRWSFNPMAAKWCCVLAVAGFISSESSFATESLAEQLKSAHALVDKSPRRALNAFNQLERAHPDCADCLIGIADAKNRLLDFDGAEQAARRALELTTDPASQRMAWTALGVSFYEREPEASNARLESNMRQAEAAFRKAYRLDAAKNETVRWNLASALEWLRRDEEAAELLSDPRHVLEIESSRPASYSQVRQPSVIKQVPPEYSGRAEALGLTGPVIVEAIVGTEGRIESIKVLQGLRGCTVSAIRAFRQWRVEPAALDGQPISVYFELTLNFEPAP